MTTNTRIAKCAVCESPTAFNDVGQFVTNVPDHHGRPKRLVIPFGNPFCCSVRCSNILFQIKETRRQKRLQPEHIVKAIFSEEDSFNTLADANLEKATSELREAIQDLTREQTPDTTGAVQHASTALEAVARKVTGSDRKLDDIIQNLPLPPDLKEAVKNIRRYSNDQARHAREGDKISIADAKFVVWTTCAVISYLNDSST